MSRFRSGCHMFCMLTVVIGNVHADRKVRLCLVCNSSQHVEGAITFFLIAPYTLYQSQACKYFSAASSASVSNFVSRCEANAFSGSIRSCSPLKSNSLTQRACVNRAQSVGPQIGANRLGSQLIPRTLNTHTHTYTPCKFVCFTDRPCVPDHIPQMWQRHQHRCP